MNSRSLPQSLFRRTRRGVILLLVLGMMMMFALLTLTFMVVTSQSQRTAESGARKDTIVDYKNKEIGAQDAWNGLLELLRGSSNSAIGHHGAIENLYSQPVVDGVDQLEFKIVRCSASTDTGRDELYRVSQWGPFYIGKANVTTANRLSNNGRARFAPTGSFDPTIDISSTDPSEVANTGLTNELIGLCLYPSQNVANRTLSIEEIADLMGNVLTFTKPRGDGDAAYARAFGQIQNTSARIVSKQVIRGGNQNFGGSQGVDSRYDDCILVVIRPFTPMILNDNNGTAISYFNTTYDYTDFRYNGFFTRCIVNGAPFSGPGIGYGVGLGGERPFSWEAALGVKDGDPHVPLPLAMRPNSRAPNSAVVPNSGIPFEAYKEYLDKKLVQMNVDYTAPDTNNMFLAWYDRRWNGSDWNLEGIIPSFLRPSLIPYAMESLTWRQGWGKSTGTRLTDVQRMDMLRKIVLRPLPFDHPNFTGSNPQWDFSSVPRNQWTATANSGTDDPRVDQWVGKLAELAHLCGGLHWVNENNGDGTTTRRLRPGLTHYDVDNDGDGIREGIWIDAGLPVRMSASGQMYKPLVSFTVLDMDGRVNVNTHGNHGQNLWSENYDFGRGSSLYSSPEYEKDGRLSNNVHRIADPQRVAHATPQQRIIPRGNGYGPAGVRIAYALDAILGVVRDLNNVTAYPGIPYNDNEFARVNATRGEIAAWHLMNGVSTKVTSKGNVSPTPETVGLFYWLIGRYGLNASDALPARPENDDKNPAADFWATILYEWYLPADGNNTDNITNPTNTGGAPPDLWDTAVVAFDVFGQRLFSPVPFSMGNFSSWGAVRKANPYRFDPYNDMRIMSDQASDQRFTPAELENLLRQTDVDQAYLPKRLEQLLSMNIGLDSNGNPVVSYDPTLARRGRDFLTTESHDIPLPNPRYGSNPGIYTLLYKCVEDQVIRSGVANGTLDLTQYDQFPVENRRAMLRVDLANVVSPLVDKLIALLPEQIRNGEKLDLNQLTQKNTWVDPSNLYGLQERADLARGIYILLMAMSYQQLYGVDEVFPDVGLSGRLALSSSKEANPPQYGQVGYRYWAYAEPYFEQAFAQEDRLNWPAKSGNDKKKAQELARQVMATRLAQYAINLIDYADADATMSPMIFDIDPFAIVYGTNDPAWQVTAQNHPLTVNTCLSCWFDLSTNYLNDRPSRYTDSRAGFASLLMPYFDGSSGWSNTKLRSFLATSIPDADVRLTPTIGATPMCRVRMIFGMERSDLLLTETLATHDLGIADTNADDYVDEKGEKKPRYLSDGDPDFDQVKVPEASAWFELLCTANPNQVIYPSDLYSCVDKGNGGIKLDPVTGQKLWYLDLSKKAPASISSNGAYEYPVWHLAISESTNPLGVSSSHGNSSNNIALRLADRKGSPVTFSLQTQQPPLDGFAMTGFNRFYGSILGPTDGNKTSADDDVKIDRIVWFFKNNSRYPDVFPNWEKIYWARNNSSYVGPNTPLFQPHELLPSEYLVVAPRVTTFLGSREKGQTAMAGVTRGFPSGECIDLRDLVPAINGGSVQNPLFTGAKMPKVVIAAAMPPHDWTDSVHTANLGVGIRQANGAAPDNAGLNGANNANSQVGIGINISAPNPNRNTGGPNYDFDTAYNSFYKEPDPNNPNSANTAEDTGGFNDNRYSDDYKYFRIVDEAGNVQTGTMKNLYKKSLGAEQAGDYYDIPFEAPEDSYGIRSNPHKASGPIMEDHLFGNGTIPMARSVVLQRLANPNLAYDPIVNPYITVDWSMIDLTVFTGEEDVDTDIPNDQISKILKGTDDAATDKKNHGGDKKDRDSAQGVDVLETPQNMPGDEWDLRIRLSSRQWGRTGMPIDLRNNSHPNPWARAIDPEWIIQHNKPLLDSRVLDPSLLIGGDATKDKAGTYDINNSPMLNAFMFAQSNEAEYHKKFDAAEIKKLNFPHRPQHSLGRLNWMYYSDNDPGKLYLNQPLPVVDGEFLHETRFTNQSNGVRAFYHALNANTVVRDGTKPRVETGLTQYFLKPFNDLNTNVPPLSRAIPPNVFRGGRSGDGDHLGRIVLTNSGETGTDYFGNPLLGAPIVVNFFQDHTASLEGNNYSNFSDWDYRPFVNLAWNNAPYPTPYEIMSVPASAPGRFGLEFVDREREDLRLYGSNKYEPRNQYDLVLTNRFFHVDVNTTVTPNVYTPTDAWNKVGSLGSGGRFGYPLVDPNDPAQTAVGAPGPEFKLPGLGHLLNFHHSSPNVAYTKTGISRLAPRNLSMNLGALLDHVQVPSRFQGTKEWVYPGVYPGSVNGVGRYSISTFREPGKINLNTLPEPSWLALLGDRVLPQAADRQDNPFVTAGPMNTQYDALSTSRRLGTPNYIGTAKTGIDGIVDNSVGRVNTTNSFVSPEPYQRRDFAFPFRSQAAGNFVAELEYPVVFQSPAAPTEGYGIPDPADATMLRRYYLGEDAATKEQPFRPLLAPVVGGEFGKNWTSNLAHHAPPRTVTEEFEGLQRLSNMTTTRSNVFAVWVTVGYFEAEQVNFANEVTSENPVDKLKQIYPDGYKYGKELGYGSGTEEMFRHRSFYLIDRTIPVGFRRGEDFNVDKTVILKKAIE